MVRSLVSIPAGANHMPMGQFLALTTLGSGVRNSLFVGLGFALGSRWQQIGHYRTWFDLAIIAFFAVSAGVRVTMRLRARRARSAAHHG